MGWHLASQVPELDGDSTPGDLAHVETHCGDHVLMERSGGYDVHQGCLPGILKSDQGQLHFLLEEEAATTNAFRHIPMEGITSSSFP